MPSVLLAAAAIFYSPAAFGAQQSDDLVACAAIEKDAARLACFDAVMAGRSNAVEEPASETKNPANTAARAAEPASPGGDYVVLTRAEAEELRRKAAADERVVKREPYESKIVRVFTTGYNTRNVELENGEYWRELRGGVGTKPRRGDVARLAPASFGSWTIQYGDRSTKFKARRTK